VSCRHTHGKGECMKRCAHLDFFSVCLSVCASLGISRLLWPQRLVSRKLQHSDLQERLNRQLRESRPVCVCVCVCVTRVLICSGISATASTLLPTWSAAPAATSTRTVRPACEPANVLHSLTHSCTLLLSVLCECVPRAVCGGAVPQPSPERRVVLSIRADVQQH
jgi:hypothetical protein